MKNACFVKITAVKTACAGEEGFFVYWLVRSDGGGAGSIKRMPSKPNKRHKGKVEVPPVRIGKRVELAHT
jgi:hypothetical protein